MGKLHIQRVGSGEKTLVFLHGWGQTSEAMMPLARLFGESYQVLCPDLPGFGRSEAPEEVWSSFDYARDIANRLKEKGVEKAVFAGHSFGGKVALSLTLMEPSIVDALVLINASGLARQRTLLQRARLALIRAISRSVRSVDRMAHTTLHASYIASRFGSSDYKNASGVMRSILVRSVNEDLGQQLGQVKVPTLLLWGEQDVETPVVMAHRLKKAIPQATLVTIPEKGHHMLAGVGSHVCFRYINRFLEPLIETF